MLVGTFSQTLIFSIVEALTLNQIGQPYVIIGRISAI